MEFTPKQIVAELDKFIIGQHEAKKAVAIALRNRWRRQQVAEPMQTEITPKNILMIGPTGVGKTEIARRLAKLANAPFIKVEATKFTEVGYIGKDVESIIRDLSEVALKQYREEARKQNYQQASLIAKEKVLDILLPSIDTEATSEAKPSDAVASSHPNDALATDISKKSSTRQRFQEMLESGKLDDKEVEVYLDKPKPRVGFVNPSGSLEDVTEHLQGLFEGFTGDNKKQRHKMLIKDALKAITEEEASKLVNEEEVRVKALHHVEQNGIVFIDEIDKVAIRSSGKNIDVSRSGVQRDLLPLVEGTTVSTKCGMIKTDHILFIASGAFHLSKPSDLLPELQGRFPIRVELTALTVDDFKKILTSTDACLIEQYKALLATEGVKVEFESDAIDSMAQYAYHVNEKTENIGARRLHTIVEKLLEDVLFDPSLSSKYDIDGAFVENKLGLISNSEDLSRYIL